MKRFQNILLVDPADGTDMGPAMERATELALRNSARLTLASTVEEIPKRRAKRAKRQGLDLQATLVGERRRKLEQLADKYGVDQLRIAVAVEVGVPFVETIRRVITINHDLVITPEEAGIAGFAPRTKHLLRKCPCPVWVVRPTRTQHTKILAAVGPDEKESGPLNKLIMDLATSLAILDAGELEVVHTWIFEGESSLRSSPHVSMASTEVDLMVEATRDEHAEALSTLVDRYDLTAIDHTVHLIKGAPEKIIPPLVIEKNVTLIVMGTVARTGIAGLVIGNTAERILDTVDCSVLAVKPQGFVTPVTVET
ncbi:MAG: universal stress protein [Actinomycetia bacterium]|nr:universal stress protein [Actinomycetes bacterium]